MMSMPLRKTKLMSCCSASLERKLSAQTWQRVGENYFSNLRQNIHQHTQDENNSSFTNKLYHCVLQGKSPIMPEKKKGIYKFNLSTYWYQEKSAVIITLSWIKLTWYQTAVCAQ